ncbi:MAG: SusD/RagB family nutrient-binding outer membrane lipoprotein [Saprospiraceae bacterium]
MKNIKFLLLVFLTSSIFLLSGCSDFLDVNDNPTKVSDVSITSLLPTVIEATSKASHQSMLSANRVSHHLDGVGSYYGEFTNGAAWVTIYLKALNNIRIIKEKSAESPHYKGIANVLEAMHVGLVADTWEDAPYSEALQGSNNVSPAYDSQEELYNSIFKLLDQAIALLESGTSFLTPGNDDLAYGGDMEKWVKLAHSLKARYLLHLSTKSNNWAEIAAEAALGISENDDNFQIFYNSTTNFNPIHDIALSNQTGNLSVTFGKMFIDMLNGESYGVDDPRLTTITTLFPDSTVYRGQANYDVELLDYSCDIGLTNWYSSISAPVVMMSNAETRFIQAEAEMNMGGNALASYEAGIKAHMNMVGVVEEDITTYMTDPAVATVSLENIMKEKYISLIFNPESWNDLKRHKFDESLFRGFVNVNSSNFDEIERNGPGQRALYPSTELSRNEAQVNAHLKEFDAPMWKDL